MLISKEIKLWLKSNWLVLGFLLGLATITYLNSFNNAFLSDDIAEIRDNPNIGNLSNLAKAPFGFIRLILYYIVFHIGGLNPFFFRMINIFFHLGSIFLIFGFVDFLLSKKVAFFTAALFAIHPAISESIVWISGGIYPQYTFFFLLSLCLYILSQRIKKTRYYWFSQVSYLFAFMSHPQMPLSLFLIFILYEFSFGNLRKNWIKILPFFGISLVYVLIDLSEIPERITVLQKVHYQERGVDNIFLIIPIALTSYFELIFWPKALTLYHSELGFNFLQFVVRFAVIFLYFGVTIFAFFKSKKLFFFLSLFFLALSPTLTPFRFNWIVAERYLYLPILGIIISVVFLVEQNIHRIKLKNLDIYIFSLIILLLSIRTFIRNIDWKSEDNLWISASKTSPSSPNNHNNLGDMYGRWGDKQKAIQEFQTAIALKPNYADAYHNMANAYRELGDLEKALQSYQKATELNPNLWQSYQNIAAIYFAQKQYDKALENMQKAIAINPKNLNLYINLGVLYLASGNKEKAKEVFSQILSVDPQNQLARQGLTQTAR